MLMQKIFCNRSRPNITKSDNGEKFALQSRKYHKTDQECPGPGRGPVPLLLRCAKRGWAAAPVGDRRVTTGPSKVFVLGELRCLIICITGGGSERGKRECPRMQWQGGANSIINPCWLMCTPDHPSARITHPFPQPARSLLPRRRPKYFRILGDFGTFRGGTIGGCGGPRGPLGSTTESAAQPNPIGWRLVWRSVWRSDLIGSLKKQMKLQVRGRQRAPRGQRAANPHHTVNVISIQPFNAAANAIYAVRACIRVNAKSAPPERECARH